TSPATCGPFHQYYLLIPTAHTAFHALSLHDALPISNRVTTSAPERAIGSSPSCSQTEPIRNSTTPSAGARSGPERPNTFRYHSTAPSRTPTGRPTVTLCTSMRPILRLRTRPRQESRTSRSAPSQHGPGSPTGKGRWAQRLRRPLFLHSMILALRGCPSARTPPQRQDHRVQARR